MIIIDNSDSGSICQKYLNNICSSVTTVYRFNRNLGHAFGLNFAILKATTDYLLIMDSDTQMIKSPVKKMLRLMDNETYEQIEVAQEAMGAALKWLKDGGTYEVMIYENNVIGVEAPSHMELLITHTEPGFKGDTAQGGTKPAIVETGTTINVPLFVENGEKILVDTRVGEYLRRV